MWESCQWQRAKIWALTHLTHLNICNLNYYIIIDTQREIHALVLSFVQKLQQKLQDGKYFPTSSEAECVFPELINIMHIMSVLSSISSVICGLEHKNLCLCNDSTMTFLKLSPNMSGQKYPYINVNICQTPPGHFNLSQRLLTCIHDFLAELLTALGRTSQTSFPSMLLLSAAEQLQTVS